MEAVETARLGLRLSEELRDEFLARVMEVFEEFRQRSDAAATGEAWSVFFAFHPDPNQPRSGG
jgi:hypothetical protein